MHTYTGVRKVRKSVTLWVYVQLWFNGMQSTQTFIKIRRHMCVVCDVHYINIRTIPYHALYVICSKLQLRIWVGTEPFQIK
jgi:hypothetical protein